jgi:hypothetical protein
MQAAAFVLVLVFLAAPVAAQYKPEFKMSIVVSEETSWGRAATSSPVL